MQSVNSDRLTDYGRSRPEARLAHAVITEALMAAHAGALLECRACRKRARGLRKYLHGCTSGCLVVSAKFTPHAIFALDWLMSPEARFWADVCGLGVETLQEGLTELHTYAKKAYFGSAALRAKVMRAEAARRRAQKQYQKRWLLEQEGYIRTT